MQKELQHGTQEKGDCPRGGRALRAATSAMAQVGEIPDRYGPFTHGHDMMWGSSQWGGFGMVLGPIFMILIVVGIVAGMIYLLRLFGAIGPAVRSHPAHDRALALLKERYAKGEIDSIVRRTQEAAVRLNLVGTFSAPPAIHPKLQAFPNS